jgi:hypothetical protein
MNSWPQENIDFARQDRDQAWQAYMEMFEAAVQRGASQPDQAPGPVYAHNLRQAHEAWWHAEQELQKMLDYNERAREAAQE